MRKRMIMGWWAGLLAAVSAQEPLGVTSRPGETLFRVWAPNARSVEVVGDFNGWRASAAERMSLDPNTGIWSVAIPRNRPTGPYRFLINRELRRRDPYARAVAPDGQSSWFYDPAAFPWEDDRPVSPPLDELVIYELHVGTFHDPKPQDRLPGTFYDAIRKLDHLADLGINAVCVMPVHEFNGHYSWGYNPCDLFAVEQAYGGPDGLKTFVKACHKAGIAVHLDVVHNHYGPDNLDLLHFDGPPGLYFYQGRGIGSTPWGPRVKFDEPMVRRFVWDNILMWLEEYHVDGFRWDSTINIRAFDHGAEPIPAGAQMLEDINRQIRSRYPHVVSIAEDSLDIGNFHASWDYEFHNRVLPVLSARRDADRDVGALVDALAFRPATMARVVYVDNHDEAGKINRQTRIASDVAPADPSGETARRLCALGAVLTFTAPGIPLLFMGNEMQETGSFHDDRPLDWGKRQRHAGLVNLHRELIGLRRNLRGHGDALKGLEIRFPVVDRERNWLVYWRWHERAPGSPMVVAMNVSGRTLTNAPVMFPSPGPWVNVLDTDWARFGGGNRQEIVRPFPADRTTGKVPMTFPPYSARLFALAPGVTMTSAPPPVVEEEAGSSRKQAVSLYSGMYIVGSFNDWNPRAWPMKLTRDFVWEYRAEFRNAQYPEFKLATEDGSLFWGTADEWPITVPYQGTLQRRGVKVHVDGVLDGTYRIRFNENTLEFSIEPIAAGPRSAASDMRTWTAKSGNQVEARLVAVKGGQVILERPNGQQISIAIERLTEADQDYLQR